MFNVAFYIGWIVIVYCVFFRRNVIRIDWAVIAKFTGFLLLLAAIRFAGMQGQTRTSGFMPGFYGIILVPWEDSFFSILGIYFFKDFLKLSKKIWIPIAIVFSVFFASGHVVYGGAWAVTTLFFPYFVSYRYGKKHGYGTAMICHILYDFTTILTVKLAVLCNLLDRF